MAVLTRSFHWKKIEQQFADNDLARDNLYDHCVDEVRSLTKSDSQAPSSVTNELEFTMTSPMWLVRIKGYHICHDLSLFDPKSFSKDNRSIKLVERVQKVAEQHKKPISPSWEINVKGVGDVRLKMLNNDSTTPGNYKMITIKDVLYVPSMQYNVLSLSAGGINKFSIMDTLISPFACKNLITIAVPNTSKKRSGKTAPLYVSLKLEVFNHEVVPFVIDYTHFGGNGNHNNKTIKDLKISALEAKAPRDGQLTGVGDVVMV